MTTKSTVSDTLQERRATHGDYAANARLAQQFRYLLRVQPNWPALPDPLRESLEQIVTKMARVLASGGGTADNFHDIQGYARLAELHMLGQSIPAAPPSAPSSQD